MSEDQPQETPQAHITFTASDKGWAVDSNVQNWEWHILKIAAEIKKTL